VAIEHRQEALGFGGITRLDDDIDDQPALAGGQVKLVSVLNPTTALDDDVGVRFEQTHQLLACRHRLVVEHPALALGDDARDQRQVMVDLGAPARRGRSGNLVQLCGGRLQFGLAGLGGGDENRIPRWVPLQSPCHRRARLAATPSILSAAGPKWLEQGAAREILRRTRGFTRTARLGDLDNPGQPILSERLRDCEGGDR